MIHVLLKFLFFFYKMKENGVIFIKNKWKCLDFKNLIFSQLYLNQMTMKRLFLIAVMVACTFAGIAQNSPEVIFNGKDLSGWKVYGTEKWYVQDGLLICESGPDKQYGYLATEQWYDDFVLEVEFKQEANGNSGIFFRSTIDGTKISGWQVEVAPPNHDTGGIYESYGRGWIAQIPDEKEGYLKMGEWNKMKIKVVGNNVTTWLNGHEMTNLTDDKIGQGKGSIALQIHDGGGIKVSWKNLVLTKL